MPVGWTLSLIWSLIYVYVRTVNQGSNLSILNHIAIYLIVHKLYALYLLLDPISSRNVILKNRIQNPKHMQHKES